MATSRSISRPAAAAFVVGAGAGLLWVAARRYGRDRADQILDWDQISAVALRACGTAQLLEAERAALDAEYGEIVRAIAEPLASYTGTQLDLTGSEVRALDRREWVLANVANFRELLRPFEDLFRDIAPGPTSSTSTVSGRERRSRPPSTHPPRAKTEAQRSAIRGAADQ